MNDDDTFVRTLLVRAAGDPEPGDLVPPTLRGARRRRTAEVVGLVAAIALVAGVGAGVTLAAGAPRTMTITAGSTPREVIPVGSRGAPVDVTGTNIQDRQPYRLANLRGAVVVVNAFGSWCEPCFAQSAMLGTLREHLGYASAVAVLGLDERDDTDFATHWLAARGAGYPVLADPQGHLAAQVRLAAGSLPATEVLDVQGRVAARFAGPVAAATLTRVVNALRIEEGVRTTDPAPHGELIDTVTHVESLGGVNTVRPDTRPVAARGPFLTASQAVAKACAACPAGQSGKPDEVSYGLDANVNFPGQVIPVWVLTWRNSTCPASAGPPGSSYQPYAGPCETVQIVNARTGVGLGALNGGEPLEEQ